MLEKVGWLDGVRAEGEFTLSFMRQGQAWQWPCLPCTRMALPSSSSLLQYISHDRSPHPRR